MHRFTAIAAPGLEPIVARELHERGIQAERVPGGVEFEGELARACLAAQLRTPARLLVRLDDGPARSYEELSIRIRRVDWRPFLSPDSEVEVSVSSTRSKLRFRDAVEKKIRMAIRDAMRTTRSRSSRPSRRRGSPQPMAQRISARIIDDQLTLSVDAGGELLHRRGWRKQSVRAPLRENLAASLLYAAGWNGDEPLVDPFCGSGTLPIEAARLAAGLTPGSTRRYAFESWPTAASWSETSTRPGDRGSPGRLWAPEIPILGADRDAQSLLLCEQNARRAGVQVEWVHSDVRELNPPAPFGLIVANPPYGKRLGQHVQSVYSTLGRTLRDRFEGWRAIFLAPESGLARRVHREAECLTEFSNGGIRVGVWIVDF